MKKLFAASALAVSMATLVACGSNEPKGIDPKVYTDSLFAVMNADRANYTKLIIARLGPKGANVINPNEHWEDHENGALLPAQMLSLIHI